MPIIKRDKAIAAANQLIEIMKSFSTLREDTAEFVSRYNSASYNSIWANLPTAADNGDGTLGAEDANPNANHPIDTRIVIDLNRACSKKQFVDAVNFLIDFQKFLNNQAVATANRSQSMDDLANQKEVLMKGKGKGKKGCK